jgi:hypothetical protein
MTSSLAAEAGAFIQPGLCVQIVSHHRGFAASSEIDWRSVAPEVLERR